MISYYPADLTPMVIAAETVQSGLDWMGPEAQLIISTYLLTLVTLLGATLEIYKLTTIEHQLKLITRLLTALRRPMRLRRVRAVRRERKIEKQAALHVVAAPRAIRKHADVVKIQSDVINNRGRF